MAKGLKPLSRTSRLLGSAQRNPIKYATAVLTFIAALGGAIKVAPDIEPWLFTSHSYARDLHAQAIKVAQAAGEKQAPVLRDIQLDFARKALRDAKNDISKWEVELKKPTTDDELRGKINESIDGLKSSRDALIRQIDTLEKMQNIR